MRERSWDNLEETKEKNSIICTYMTHVHCTIYIRHDKYWQIAYPKVLVAQNCIKKDLQIYIFFYLRKLSRLKGQFCSTALVQGNN